MTAAFRVEPLLLNKTIQINEDKSNMSILYNQNVLYVIEAPRILTQITRAQTPS